MGILIGRITLEASHRTSTGGGRGDSARSIGPDLYLACRGIKHRRDQVSVDGRR